MSASSPRSPRIAPTAVAASSESQWERRADHFAAKAMSGANNNSDCCVQVSSGYGERHALKVWSGTGETRLGSQRLAKTVRISDGEIERSQAGVRGGLVQPKTAARESTSTPEGRSASIHATTSASRGPACRLCRWPLQARVTV